MTWTCNEEPTPLKFLGLYVIAILVIYIGSQRVVHEAGRIKPVFRCIVGYFIFIFLFLFYQMIWNIVYHLRSTASQIDIQSNLMVYS